MTAAQSANTNPYDAAVREGQRIVAEMEGQWWRLCELAYGLEPVYGEQTLARFANDIGVVPCTFIRRMSVYQAWKQAPGPECWASELARQYRSAQATANLDADWQRQQTARWFKDLYTLATEVIQQAQITHAEVPQQLLREVVEPMSAWVPTIREAGEACIKLVNDLEPLIDGGDEAECIPAEAAE